MSSEVARTVAQKLKLVVFDFDGVFTDNSVYVLDNGQESVRCSRFDGFGIRILDSLQLDCFILSKETSSVVKHRADKIKIKCFQAIDDKKAFLTNHLQKNSIHWNEVCYVGNDINDIECMDQVGLSIAVADSFPTVFAHSHLTTDLPGGHGAVREVCEYIKLARS